MRRTTQCVLALLTVVMATFLTPSALAAPINGERMTLTQPDGAKIEAIVWGDEFSAHVETPDGYTLAVDPSTKYICYAEASLVADGELRSTGIPYLGADDSAQAQTGVKGIQKTDAQRLSARGVVKGLRLSKEVRRRHVAKAQSQLWKDGRRPWDQAAVLAAPGSGTGSASSVLSAPPRVSGTTYGVVVLVDFPDRPSTVSTTEVNNAFNGATYGDPRGSLKSWVETISNGKASVSHSMVGYYRARNNTSYYRRGGEFDYGAADEIRAEAFAWADANFDFSKLTLNGSRAVAVCILYAGDVISNGWANSLWPHAGYANYQTKDGVTIGSYFMSNLGSTTPLRMGTERHELGHSVFGWPDTYDYDGDSASGGGYARETDIPCSVFRAWHNWITVVDVSGVNQTYNLPANGSTCLRYKHPTNANEYFIVEYLKKEGWNASAPDEGVLVWHVDEKGNNSYQDMTLARHYALSVEQADGKYDLERNVSAGDGDLFHAGYKTDFSSSTTPNSNWWAGGGSGFRLSQIGSLGSSTISVTVGSGAVADAKATITSPANGSKLSGSSVTFTRTNGTNALAYHLYVGTTQGGNNLYSLQMSATTATVNNLPTDGSTVYVRMWTQLSSGWQYNDYTYKANGGSDSEGIVSGAIYRITPKLSPSQGLDVYGGASSAGTAVINYTYYGSANQQWEVTSVSGGYYSLAPRHALSLAMDVFGVSTANRTKVIVWTDRGALNQLWKITAAGNGYYELTPAHATGMRLHQVSTVSGSALEIQTASGVDAQKFSFVRQ